MRRYTRLSADRKLCKAATCCTQASCQAATIELELYKAIIRAHEADPERILAREALTVPARVYQRPDELQDRYNQILARTIRAVQSEAVKT